MDREKLKELCEKATPGPWKIDTWGGLGSKTNPGPEYCRHVFGENLSIMRGAASLAMVQKHKDIPVDANAEFIAVAREALPALLAEVERMEREVKNQAEIAQKYEDRYFSEKARAEEADRVRDEARREAFREAIAIVEGTAVPKPFSATREARKPPKPSLTRIEVVNELRAACPDKGGDKG